MASLIIINITDNPAILPDIKKDIYNLVGHLNIEDTASLSVVCVTTILSAEQKDKLQQYLEKKYSNVTALFIECTNPDSESLTDDTIIIK